MIKKLISPLGGKTVKKHLSFASDIVKIYLFLMCAFIYFNWSHEIKVF